VSRYDSNPVMILRNMLIYISRLQEQDECMAQTGVEVTVCIRHIGL
jgi:hypothetical protein